MSADEVIVAEGLTKVFGGRRVAVDAVSFAVRRGEIFGFLGPNGAGKSTTIALLTTLLRPSAGRARVAGHDVAAEPLAVRRQIGYVSQDVAVDDLLTGRENLHFQGRLYHLGGRELRARVEAVLEMVDLAERADDLVATYSGGMRKRLDLAAGLLHRPQVLFLDEPTLGLDVQSRQRIWGYVRRLRDEEGVTVFLTTHYMEEADTLCDRVAIIDRGEIVALGSPRALKAGLRGDRVTLALEPGADAGAARRVLERLAGVQGVEGSGDGSVRLVVADGERAVPELLRALEQAGVRVASLSLQRPTLDDVFLHHTGRQLREEPADRLARALRRARRG